MSSDLPSVEPSRCADLTTVDALLIDDGQQVLVAPLVDASMSPDASVRHIDPEVDEVMFALPSTISICNFTGDRALLCSVNEAALGFVASSVSGAALVAGVDTHLARCRCGGVARCARRAKRRKKPFGHASLHSVD